MHNVHPGAHPLSNSRLARIASWLEPPSYTTKECDHCYVARAADSRTRGASTVSRMAQKIACNELLPYRCNIHVSQCTEAVRSLWVHGDTARQRSNYVQIIFQTQPMTQTLNTLTLNSQTTFAFLQTTRTLHFQLYNGQAAHRITIMYGCAHGFDVAIVQRVLPYFVLSSISSQLIQHRSANTIKNQKRERIFTSQNNAHQTIWQVPIRDSSLSMIGDSSHKWQHSLQTQT